MEHYELMKVLNTIWEDEDHRSLYLSASMIADQARYPHMYRKFKSEWSGDRKKNYDRALQLMKNQGWKEPVLK